MAATNRLDLSNYAFWSFTLSIVLLPIGLGGDRPIPFGLAQIGMAFCSFCLAFCPKLLSEVPVHARLRWAAGMMFLVLLWAVYQTLPFIPANWAHPLWVETALALKIPVTASISIVPEDVFKGLMRLLTYIIAGILGYVLTQDSKRAHQFVKSFWIAGTVISLYGLVLHILDMKKILWFDKWAYTEQLTSTFVNHNHFAIYAGMVLSAGLVLLMQSWHRMMRNGKANQRVADIRDWLLQQGAYRCVLLSLTFLALALSDSRAGLFCGVMGLGATLFFYQIYRKNWVRAALAGFFMFLAIAIALIVASHLSERFAELFTDYSSAGRAKVYNLTWRAFMDNPWLGYGLNGFEPEYRLYQQDMYEAFNHAHSDLMESFLDLGVFGGLALWASVGLLLSGLWHGIRHRRHDGLYAILGLSCSLMVLAHAAVDFDLQIPGVTMTWAALLGVGLAQSWSHAKKDGSR